jgi:thiol-disulfide isomerase/thioredoxin
MMKKHERVFSIFSIGLVFVLLNSSVFLSRVDASDHYMDSLSIVRFNKKVKAPTFTLKDINGKEVKLMDYRGKIVFLNFWATWCPPCRDEMPSMEKLYTKFKDKNFIMLAVDYQESSKVVKEFSEKLSLTYPILLDSDGTVGSKYMAFAIPVTYLIDQQGYLIGKAVGPRDWASHESFELFNHLLKTSPDS